MTYKEIVPNISQHFFRFDRQEDKEMHWRCNWARINLDHNNFIMSATSDCGDYNYQWCVTDSESFLNLMCRIGQDYLLGKISRESVFNLEESKKKTIENLQYAPDTLLMEYSSIEEMTNEINDIEIRDETAFFMEVERITDGLLNFDSIEIIKEYPRSAETFCEIFCKYLQPILREKLKSEVKADE